MRVPKDHDPASEQYVFSLYESPALPPHLSLEQELLATSTGKKALCMYSLSERSLDGAHYISIVEHANRLQLCVLNIPKIKGYVSVYVFRHGDSWRAFAHASLLSRVLHGGYGWSFGAEALEGYLLGYSDEEIGVWIERKKWEGFGWVGGPTINLFMSDAQSDAVRSYGCRCLPASFEGLILAVQTLDSLTLRRDALTHLPPGRVIGRCAVATNYAGTLFGARHPDATLATATISIAMCLEFNVSLKSKIEFLGVDG